MAHRPLVLQSKFVRTLCPLKQKSKKYATQTSVRQQRSQPSPFSVSDDQIAQLSSQPLHSLTLADLVRYESGEELFNFELEQSPDCNFRHGRPPLSAEALFSSANFTLSLLPTRLAHRIQALRNLPFIVVSNPNIAQIYTNYIHSLSTLLPYKERQINNLEDEIQFTEVMADLVQTHSNTIPTLARGFLECRKYISPSDVTKFLDEHLRARIGTRLIAEQHIALHLSSRPHNKGTPLSPSYIGVIDTALQPAEIIRHCESFVSEICELKYGVRPSVIIKGDPNSTFAHVPTHLEYVVTELLKNAFRATVENGTERKPIEVTIAASPDTHEAIGLEHASTEEKTKTNPSADNKIPGVTIRIRDRGGGISPDVLPNIWAYSFTTFSEDYLPETNNGKIDALNTISGAGGDSSSLAGLGYGLPLGRAYAEYFGGGIAVQSLWGWGTDVYLKLRGLGKI